MAAVDESVEVVVLWVNGVLHRLRVEARRTLLDALREDLHLTGTKKGCDHGQCGACTVLVDGRRVVSCLMLVVAQEGSRVVTVEGLTGERADRLRAEFLRHDALQCGFCTPGQICSAVGLLDEAEAGWPSAASGAGAEPAELTRAEVRERMSGNLCRCGAYPNIVAAVLAAADAGRVSHQDGGA